MKLDRKALKQHSTRPLCYELGCKCTPKDHKHRMSIHFDVTLGGPGRPGAPQGSSETPPGTPQGAPRHILAPSSNKGHNRCSKSTKNNSPKAPKSSVFGSLWRTVSHTFNAFLENSEYAIRSCLCSPNSFPSTPDTPQNDHKTHSWEHENTNSVAYRFRMLFYLKSGPQKPVNP